MKRDRVDIAYIAYIVTKYYLLGSITVLRDDL